MVRTFKSLWRDEDGATLVEYGLLVALIAAVSVAIIGTLGGQITTAFTTVSNQLTAGGGGGGNNDPDPNE